MKRFLKNSLLLLFCFAVLEIFSFLALAVFQRTIYPVRTMRAERAEVRQRLVPANVHEAFTEDFLRHDVLHPYLGFVISPPTAQDPVGFRNDISPLPKRTPSTYNVMITGGSLAAQTYDYARDQLKAELRKIPAIAGRDIHLVHIALGGFKQPQQLMALNYLLMLGGEYDLVINLDGFNETALAESENVSKGVSPVFPRLWFERVGTRTFPDIRFAMSLSYAGAALRARAAVVFSHAILQYSAAWNFLWKAVDGFAEFIQRQGALYVHRRDVPPVNFEVSGPPMNFSSRAELYQTLAQTWARSSLLMAQLAQANGARYFHFLQPNQYVEGSRNFVPGEKEKFYQENYDYAEGVKAGYPRLQAAAKEMLQNVHFYDLTPVFLTEPQTVYGDGCCHLNVYGYQRLAQEIGRMIRRDF